MVIGDITPEEAQERDREIVRRHWKAEGPKPEVDLPKVPENKAAAENVPDPNELQDSVKPFRETLPMTRFDEAFYPLQLRQSTC